MKLIKLSRYLVLFLIFVLISTGLFALFNISKNGNSGLFSAVFSQMNISIPFFDRSANRPIINRTPIPTNSVTSNPTPTIIPLPHSKKQFSVSGGIKPGPRFSRGFLDPYGPIIGDNQIININSSYQNAINLVQANLESDNKSRTITLERISGTDTDGVWQGIWKTDDTTFRKYIITFVATSTDIRSTLDLSLR